MCHNHIVHHVQLGQRTSWVCTTLTWCGGFLAVARQFACLHSLFVYRFMCTAALLRLLLFVNHVYSHSSCRPDRCWWLAGHWESGEPGGTVGRWGVQLSDKYSSDRHIYTHTSVAKVFERHTASYLPKVGRIGSKFGKLKYFGTKVIFYSFSQILLKASLAIH